MGFYPIVLELSGRPVLVVGGGAVAERKVEGLLDADAQVTVVSPTVTPRLESWWRRGAIRYIPRYSRPSDLTGHALAFVATDDGTVNAALAAVARARGVWVNAADDPDHCDFVLPAVVRRGRLLVAVATGGTSPALARLVKDELEAYFTEDYELLCQVMGEVRRELRERAASPPAGAWRDAVDAEFRRLVTDGRRDAAVAHLLERLRATACS